MNNSMNLLCSTIILSFYCLQISAETLTLEKAKAYTLSYNSKLKIARSGLEIKQLEIEMAERWSNPNLELNIENLNGGSGPDDLEREEEITLSQKIETLGKRKAKKQLAGAEKESTRKEYERLRSSLLLETSQRFYTLLKHQSKTENTSNNLQFIETSLKNSEEQYKAGKIPLTDLRRNKLEVMNYRIQLNSEILAVKKAVLQLQNLWDQRETSDIEIVNHWNILSRPPKKPQIDMLKNSNPDLQHLMSEINRTNQFLQLQKKNRFPDISLMAGAKKTSGASQTGFQIGLEIELPVFNSGKLEVAKSRLKLQEKKLELSQRESSFAKELERLNLDLLQTHEIIHSLKTEMLPLAELELETLRLSYQVGKHTYLDVLDRMGIVFSLRNQIIDYSYEYMLYQSELQYILGEFLK